MAILPFWLKERVLYGQRKAPEDRIWGMVRAWAMVVQGLIKLLAPTARITGTRIRRSNTESREYSDEETANLRGGWSNRSGRAIKSNT